MHCSIENAKVTYLRRWFHLQKEYGKSVKPVPRGDISLTLQIVPDSPRRNLYPATVRQIVYSR